jgi:hypothetical protein
MSATSTEVPPIRARIPADLDAPDRLVAGLSAHQLLILAAAAVPLYAMWQALGDRVPVPALAAISAALAALAVAVTLGRRDGLSLDTWLVAALTHRLRPRRLVPAAVAGPVLPAWAPSGTEARRERPPGVLRLPAQAIGPEGVIDTGTGSCLVLVAAGTVTAGLHTPAESGALVAGYARWLNGLSGGVQIVVSARRLDLGARALHIAETAHRLPHPALAASAIEYAEHLLDLCEDEDPLTRTVTIACTANTGPAGAGARSHPGRERTRGEGGAAAAEAARRGARTAAALSVLGSHCRILNGAEASALLSAAVDPWGPAGPDWQRTPPGAPVGALVAGPAQHRWREETGGQVDEIGWADEERQGGDPGEDEDTGWVEGDDAQRWSR